MDTNETKDLLTVFEVTKERVEQFLLTVSPMYKFPDCLMQQDDLRMISKRLPRKRKKFYNKEIDLILMYLAFKASLELRNQMRSRVFLPGDWDRLRSLEQSFLDLTKKAEHVPPEVLTLGFVIHHYWSYLDFVQPGTD